MDDVLRRLGLLESDVSVIKTEVAAISAQLPSMATKEDVALLKADVAQLRNMATKEDVALLKADVNLLKAEFAQLPFMATKADVALLKADINLVKADINLVKADVSDAKTAMVQWTVGTIIAVTALVFTIAKFVH